MRSTKGVLCVGAAAGLLSLTAGAQATVLLFEPVPAPDGRVLDAYGDRVTSASQGGFKYGMECGATPNVVVFYQPTLKYKLNGYGSLENFLYRENSGDKIMEIRLAADPGWLVCLSSFEMAARDGESLRPRAVKVLDAAGNELFRDQEPVIPGDENNPTSKVYSFDQPLCSPIVRIVVELTNLTIKADRIGIDTIKFGQIPIPAPSSAALLGLAGAVAVRRRRRTQG